VCAIEKANDGWIRGEKISTHPVEHKEIEVVKILLVLINKYKAIIIRGEKKLKNQLNWKKYKINN
jgi:hypothetical protein